MKNKFTKFSITFFFFVLIHLLFISYGNIPMLIYDIHTCPYSTDDYELHVFDCSNMAAKLHDHLENKGYNTSYHIGCTPNNTTCHAWLQTEQGILIESTHKFVALPFYYDEYTTKYIFDNPEDIINKGYNELQIIY